MSEENKDNFGILVLAVVVYIAGFGLGMVSVGQKKPCFQNLDSNFAALEMQQELNDLDDTEAEKLWHNMIEEKVIPRTGGSIEKTISGRKIFVPDNCYAENTGFDFILWKK